MAPANSLLENDEARCGKPLHCVSVGGTNSLIGSMSLRSEATITENYNVFLHNAYNTSLQCCIIGGRSYFEMYMNEFQMKLGSWELRLKSLVEFLRDV